MFALINKFSKKNEKADLENENAPPKPAFVMPVRIDDDELKKRIAAKLETYQPLKRESNFGGPKV